MDKYLVVIISRHDYSVGSLGPYTGDDGSEKAHQVAKTRTDENAKAVVVGI